MRRDNGGEDIDDDDDDDLVTTDDDVKEGDEKDVKKQLSGDCRAVDSISLAHTHRGMTDLPVRPTPTESTN